MVGLALVANAKPDGYTLAGTASVAVVRGPQLQKVTFKPLKSFTPIIGFAMPQHAIMVRSDAPWKNLQELVDFAKKNPNKIKYCSAGVGTSIHLAMELIALKEGIKWIHVPYKSGPEMTAALLGGHVDAAESVSGTQQLESVRLLAYFQEKRNPRRPDVPTMRELGYDFVNEAVFSILGPAGLPANVLKKLEDAFMRAAESEQFKSVINRLDLVPVHYNSEQYTQFLISSWARTEKTLKEAGIIKEVATQPY
jgi:tripartite-type tricarboxylate transporter receptor subunit TctC